MTAILDEYRSFAGAKGRLMHEQYIEFFDVDLVTLPAEPDRLPEWFIDYNLIDVRKQAHELELKRRELEVLEAREADENAPKLTEEELRLKRRILFALRCAQAQRSTVLCSPGIRMGKQSLIDDEDDD
jgi:hypothetical protein